MKLRSLLFVPGDRPDRFAKAATSGADAIILDLEDSVVPDRKDIAREAVAKWLTKPRQTKTLVRINPLDSAWTDDDVKALSAHPPDGIVLPKAEGAASVNALLALGIAACPILPIATETPSAVFQLGSYMEVAEHLLGLSWGVEDVSAAIGSIKTRDGIGFTPPYEMIRALALFGAHAAQVPAIDTVFTNIADAEGLERYVARARVDGFTGMLAIHPSQIAIINAGFTPTEAEIAEAQAIIAAFAAAPQSGALMFDGRMIDRPHLLYAQRIIAGMKD